MEEPAVPTEFPEPYDNPFERGEIQGIEEELDELGRTVSEVLETDYIHRSREEFGFFRVTNQSYMAELRDLIMPFRFVLPRVFHREYRLFPCQNKIRPLV